MAASRRATPQPSHRRASESARSHVGLKKGSIPNRAAHGVPPEFDRFSVPGSRPARKHRSAVARRQGGKMAPSSTDEWRPRSGVSPQSREDRPPVPSRLEAPALMPNPSRHPGHSPADRRQRTPALSAILDHRLDWFPKQGPRPGYILRVCPMLRPPRKSGQRTEKDATGFRPQRGRPSHSEHPPVRTSR